MSITFSNGFTISPAQSLITDGMVLRLDASDTNSYNGSGTTWFDIKNNYDFTLTNSPLFNSLGYFDFNGTNQYAIIPHDSALKPTSELTIEQWLSADDWTSGDSVNYKTSLSCTQGGGYAHYIWSGTWRSYVRVGGSYQIPTFDVSGLTGWHHFVTTFDGRYTKLYVDGVLVDTEDLGTSGNVIGYDADNSIVIGTEAAGTPGAIEAKYWDGKISTTLLYNRALTQMEVLQNYNATKSKYDSMEESIVTNALQLYLTAGNSTSYGGSGTTWTDLSSNGYLTTLTNTPTYNSGNGGYFSFDGSDYVDTNQSLESETFSVGGWFRTSAAGIKMFLSKEENAGNPWNYRIWLNGGRITADMSQVTTQATLTSPLSTYNNGNWYQVMFTRDDSNWYLYVNGAQVNTRTDPYTGNVVNSQELWIGRSAFQGGSYQFVGDISEVMIYNRVLTSAEILHNYNVTKTRFGL